MQTVVFDKTGTITEGKPVVTDIALANGLDENALLQLAASAEKGSEHPLGDAIVQSAEDRRLHLLPLERFEAIPGRGIEAQIDGKALLLGNEKLMSEKGVSLGTLSATSARLAENGKTPMFVAVDGAPAGVVAVADIPKESSARAIRTLSEMGLEVAMLTGDNQRTAQAIARQVGMDRVFAEVLPEDKASMVKKLQEEGRRVAMVGDG